MIINLSLPFALVALTIGTTALAQGGNIDEAIMAYERRDYRGAYKLFKNEETVNPASGLARLYLAHIDVAYGEKGSAADSYLNALKLLPKDDYEHRIQALRPLVSILSQSDGGSAKALEIVEKEMKIFGNTDMLLFCKAACDRYNARNIDTWRTVADAHISDDIDLYAYESIAKISRKNGDLNGAIEAYSAALNVSPTDNSLLNDRASAYWMAGDTSAAVNDACLNFLANNTQVNHSVLLMCYDRIQSTLDMMRDGRYGHLVDLAKFLIAYEANRYADAYELSKAEDFKMLGLYGGALSAVGLYGKAEEALAADGDNKNALRRLGMQARNYERMGNFSDAKRCLDMAIGMDPANVDYYMSQAELCLMSNDAAGAAAYADTILALMPVSSMPTLLRAYIQHDEREKAKQLAQNYIETKARCDDPFPAPYVAGSQLFYYAIAGDTLSFARGVDSAWKYGNCDDWFNIALAYVATGREDEAIDAISTAFERGFCHFVYIEKAPEFHWIMFSEKFNDMMARMQEEQTRRIERLLND